MMKLVILINLNFKSMSKLGSTLFLYDIIPDQNEAHNRRINLHFKFMPQGLHSYFSLVFQVFQPLRVPMVTFKLNEYGSMFCYKYCWVF